MKTYTQLLGFAAVVAFFGNVDLYLYLVGFWSVTPRDWILALGVLSLPLVLRPEAMARAPQALKHPLTIWCAAYLLVSAAWLAARPGDTAMQEFRDRVLTCVFLGLTTLLFAEAAVRVTAGMAVAVVLAATVVINGIQLVDPTYFLVPVATRSSGLYANANQCGAAMVLGMILLMTRTPVAMRPVIAVTAGAGVLMTLSRSALAGWAIAATAAARSIAPRLARRSAVAALAVVVAFALSAGALWSLGGIETVFADSDQRERMRFFRTLDTSDYAAQERLWVAARAWEMFLESPAWGHGLGATQAWAERVSTHNLSLYFMVDHGVLGAFILPALLAIAYRGGSRENRHGAVAFCAFIAWQSLFSHNVLTERYFLVAFALFIAGGIPPRATPPATPELEPGA